MRTQEEKEKIVNLTRWRNVISGFLHGVLDRFNISKEIILDIGYGDSYTYLKAAGYNVLCGDKSNWSNKVNVQVDLEDEHSTKNAIPSEFQIVTCCEVLEHVSDPFAAARNLMNLVKKDGFAIVTSPINLEWHPSSGGYYKDNWRFMPGSYDLLFKGFKVEEHTFESDRPNFPLGICAVVRH